MSQLQSQLNSFHRQTSITSSNNSGNRQPPSTTNKPQIPALKLGFLDKNKSISNHIIQKQSLMQSKQKSQQQQQYDKDIDNDSQESESEYEEVCYKKENVQSMHEQVLNTWRSIESNIATTQREGSTQLTQQALELSSQIQKLLENQNKLEVQRDYEETFGRQKILELINNLELKNLKISEQNRQLINDIMSGSINVNTSSLLNGEFKLELTQEKDGAVQATQGAMGQTIGLLVTLNEIIKDEENEYEKRLEIEVQEKDQVILNLQQEMENQQKRFDKQKILTELNIIDMRKQINELESQN